MSRLGSTDAHSMAAELAAWNASTWSSPSIVVGGAAGAHVEDLRLDAVGVHVLEALDRVMAARAARRRPRGALAHVRHGGESPALLSSSCLARNAFWGLAASCRAK